MGYSPEQTVAVIDAVKQTPNYFWQIIVGVTIAVASAIILRKVNRE